MWFRYETDRTSLPAIPHGLGGVQPICLVWTPTGSLYIPALLLMDGYDSPVLDSPYYDTPVENHDATISHVLCKFPVWVGLECQHPILQEEGGDHNLPLRSIIWRSRIKRSSIYYGGLCWDLNLLLWIVAALPNLQSPHLHEQCLLMATYHVRYYPNPTALPNANQLTVFSPILRMLPFLASPLI